MFSSASIVHVIFLTPKKEIYTFEEEN